MWNNSNLSIKYEADCFLLYYALEVETNVGEANARPLQNVGLLAVTGLCKMSPYTKNKSDNLLITYS